MSGLRPPAFQRNYSTGRAARRKRASPSSTRRGENRSFLVGQPEKEDSGRDEATPSSTCQCRRHGAKTSPPPASGRLRDRRSEIDRCCGLGKPPESHAARATTSTACAATPAVGDTLAPRFLVTDAAPGRGRCYRPSAGRDVVAAPRARRRSRPRSGSMRPRRTRAAIYSSTRRRCARTESPPTPPSTLDRRPDGRVPLRQRDVFRLPS